MNCSMDIYKVVLSDTRCGCQSSLLLCLPCRTAVQVVNDLARCFRGSTAMSYLVFRRTASVNMGKLTPERVQFLGGICHLHSPE